MTPPARRGSGWCVTLLLAIPWPGTPATAQAPDTVQVVAGAHYAADGLRERLLGRDYRIVWTGDDGKKIPFTAITIHPASTTASVEETSR